MKARPWRGGRHRSQNKARRKQPPSHVRPRKSPARHASRLFPSRSGLRGGIFVIIVGSREAFVGSSGDTPTPPFAGCGGIKFGGSSNEAERVGPVVFGR